MPCHLSVSYGHIGNGLSYHGIQLKMGPKAKAETFNSGNVTLDYWTAFLVARWRSGSEDYPIMGSSSLHEYQRLSGGPNMEDPGDILYTAAQKNARDYLTQTGEMEDIDRHWLSYWEAKKKKLEEELAEVKDKIHKLYGKLPRRIGALKIPSRDELYQKAMERSRKIKNGEAES